MTPARKSQLLRSLTAFLFILLAVLGLLWHTGWGTLSSFGWRDIAAVCPLGGIEVMLADGTFIPRAFWGILAIFILCLVFGRIFCGWLCPVPLIKHVTGTEDVRAENYKSNAEVNSASPSRSSYCVTAEPKAKTNERIETLKDVGPFAVLIGALSSSAVFGFPVFCLVCPVGLTFALVIALWRLFEFNDLSWSIGIFAVFLFLELFVLRRWCSRFCPLGAAMTLLSRFNKTFRPKIAKEKCITCKGLDCRVCRTACPEGIDLTKASSGMLAARCTKCRACADACPTKAIHFPFFEKKQAEAKKFCMHAVGEGRSGTGSGDAPLSSGKKIALAESHLSPETILKESARCIECGACTAACPQKNPIADWMADIREGRLLEAGRAMLAKGGLPEICGRVCPSERLCESACPLGHEPLNLGGAVPISAIEASLSELVIEREWHPYRRYAGKDQSVSIVGAGPAGMACAEKLARMGAQVTIYDAAPEIGGLLTFGIPAFKLEKAIILRRRRLLRELGIELKLGKAVCDGNHGTEPFDAILAQSDAVFVAVGAEKPRCMGVEGEDACGVLQAQDYLRSLAVRHLKSPDDRGRALLASVPDLRGKHVLVVGAGDTAMDCLRAAIRDGAASAAVICRKPKDQIRALPSEVKLAEEEGATFICGIEPTAVLTHEDGGVVGLKVESLTTKGVQTLEADIVITACGFEMIPMPWLAHYVEMTDLGRIAVDEFGKTSHAKIFAGGDAVRGPALAVNAVSDGLKAADVIARMLDIPPLQA